MTKSPVLFITILILLARLFLVANIADAAPENSYRIQPCDILEISVWKGKVVLLADWTIFSDSNPTGLQHNLVTSHWLVSAE